MAVGLSTITVDPEDITTVDVSDGDTCTVLISSACTLFVGENISHRTTKNATKLLFLINLLIGGHLSKMSDSPIISFYATKKGAYL